jgi:hypothetical protein
MKIKNLPNIKLSKNQKIWLEEAWKLLRTSGRKVTYQRIRANTIDKTGKDFNPHSIDNLLARDYVSNITLLGLILIDSHKEIIEVTNQTLKHIKAKLLENPDFRKFRVSD